MLKRVRHPVSPLRAVEILGVASGCGAVDRGCGDGPPVLEENGLVPFLRAAGSNPVWHQIPAKAEGVPSGPEDCARLSRRLARHVERAVRADRFPVILGGDHSSAIGTWSGVARAVRASGPPGLVWVDAHMDAHVPETSLSGALHGMPVACLLGHGAEPFRSLAGARPALDPRTLALVGVRSFELCEAAFLERLGVRVFAMKEVLARGLGPVMEDAFAIAAAASAGFGVSVDLDAVDPGDAPGVGSPEPGGLSGAGLVAALTGVGRDPQCLGLEVAEFNPHHDPDGRTARLVRDLLAAGLSGRIDKGEAA